MDLNPPFDLVIDEDAGRYSRRWRPDPRGHGDTACALAYWKLCSYPQGMRRKASADTLKRFMQELAEAARSSGNVYFTGGATALLLGFREMTIDIDVKLDPEPEGAFEAIAALKNRLEVNVELASPDDFIPRASDWRERSPHIITIGRVQFFHYEFALQALAKIERGYGQDLADVAAFLRGGYVTPQELRRRFQQIEPGLVRYPAIDAQQFKRKLEDFLTNHPQP